MFKFRLPDWYDRWKKENPVTMGSLYGPLLLLGVGFSAWIFAIGIMIWYNWAEPETMQTGPRGAGMGVASLGLSTVSDPTIEAYYTEEAYVPEQGEELARDVYENVQVLGDLTDSNFNRLMRSCYGLVRCFVLSVGICFSTHSVKLEAVCDCAKNILPEGNTKVFSLHLYITFLSE